MERKLKPKQVEVKSVRAQWLSGKGSGAWFEIYDLGHKTECRYKDISLFGAIDCDGYYEIHRTGFDINLHMIQTSNSFILIKMQRYIALILLISFEF